MARTKSLLAALDMPVRPLLHEKGTPDAELGLDDPGWPDEALLGVISRFPILMNRPVVETALGVTPCRPSEAVLELLPQVHGTDGFFACVMERKAAPAVASE